jgi:AcrR family transcriptional regulator
MPRSTSANDALRLATRERLLHAAMHCFASKGFAGTSIRDIASTAGVATGLLYAHFDSKDTLLLSVFAQSMQQVQSTFAEALQPATTEHPLEHPVEHPVATLIRAAVRTVREHLPFWQLSYALRHQPEVIGALGPALGAWQQEIVQHLRQILAHSPAHQASDAEALALFAQIDGLCQHFAADPERYPVDEAAEVVISRWTTTGSMQ